MLKVMLIQRCGVTMHKIINETTNFDDFVELVSFENFGKDVKPCRQHKEVQVPYSGTTYTMLEMPNAAQL
jgi:hypothetical protein